MPRSRPFDCPACGHERIMQRQMERPGAGSRVRVPVTHWICGLCQYQWSRPAPSALQDGPGPV